MPLNELPVKSHQHQAVYHLEFIELIFPFACAISTMLCCAISYFAPERQARKIPAGKYVFRYRAPLWIMQVALVALRILLSFSMKDVVSWNIIVPISVLIAVVLDNHNIASSTIKVRCWMSLYLIVLTDTTYVMIVDISSPVKICAFICSVGVLALSVFRSLYKFEEYHDSPPTEEYTCNLPRYLSFSFLNEILIRPVVLKGSMRQEEVPAFSDFDSCRYTFQKYLNLKVAGANLLHNMLRGCFSLFLRQGVCAFLAAVLIFIAPLALERILRFLSKGERSAELELIPLGMMPVVFLLGAGPFVTGLFENLNYGLGRHLGIQLRSVLLCELYGKLLLLDTASVADASGRLSNLVSTDVNHIVFCYCYGHSLWTDLLQIAICVYLLVRVLGYAAWGGVLVMLVALPIGSLISMSLRRMYQDLSKVTDQRLGIINEVVQGIKVIKLFALESLFLKKISVSRNEEVAQLLGVAYYNAVLSSLWTVVLPLVAVTSFLVHTQLMGAALSPAEGFTALTLFQILRYPLTDLPSSIDMLMHALTSLSRIENFLQLPEVTGLRLEHQHDTAVVVKCADFGWPSRRFDAGADEYDECACYGPPKYRIVSSGDDPDVERGNPSEGVVILKDVRIQIKKASFTVICAMTGAGKSTLLAGLLGECRISQGSAQLSDEGGIFLCTQSSYIQSGTLRENILFGSEFNESRYRHVLFCCALDKDMIALPDGDMTEIGEKGVNLSGGQQQRVNLARAAYSSMSTVLLDDPLSALDAAVAEHLVRHLLCGFLKGRTRVLVTHQLSLTLPVCHSVIFINQRGHVKQCASVGLDSIDDLRDTNPVTKSFVKMIKDAKNGPIISAVNAGEEFYRGELASVKSGGCSDQLIHLETKAVGGVLAHVYLYYAQACGGPLVLGLIVSISFAVSIMELTQNGFLGRWMTQMERGDVDASSSLRFYLITVCVSISAEVFSAFYKARVSMFAAKCIHDALVCRLLKAPLSWFESTPVGRIQNRLSSDINTVDNELMGSLVHFVGCFLGNLQVVLCIGLTLPFLLLCFIPIVGVTSWIAYQYLVTSRELKRLESISRSPVLTAFAETLLGLPTIRASCHQSRYMKDIIQRIDAFNRCHLYLWLSNRWLNIRMCILGSAVVGCVGLAVVCGGFRLSGGAAGLVLVYSLTFTESLTWIARTHAESQMNLNSVERIKEYSFVEQENHEGIKEVSGSLLGEECDSPEGKIPNLALATERACRGWPMLGAIEFRAVCLSYNTRANVLKGVSFRAEGGMKVGIVGRTGAGKSSILSALFRIVEPTSGQIIVDGVNLLTIPLHELRSNIAIVSQEPILFAGSVRFNLDPYDEKSDLTLWAALKKVKMNDYVASFMPGENLTDKMINEKGGNLSAGQKQLLCLARAIVKESKILVMDEATASVDHETDLLIQNTIRNELRGCTVLCVAHRLHTIADYDRVVVLVEGRVAEYGTPLELMRSSSSLFRDMCEATGDFDNLLKVARA